MFLTWIIFGALMGGLAASRKGFSIVVGVLAGMFLGILAPLMFFVSGISRSERKCPHCAEMIKTEAIVCRHCGRDVQAAQAKGPTYSHQTKG